jgi:acetyl esterase/lipase
MAKKTNRRKSEEWTPPERKAPEDVFGMPDGHHVGYTNGFTKRGDELHLAPAHTQPMEEIRADRAALDDYIDAVNRHAHKQLQALRRREDAWWRYVEQDLGLSRGAAVYYYGGGYLKPKPKQAADAVDPHATNPGTPTTRD